MNCHLLTTLFAAAAACLLPAQIDRESDERVDYHHLRNATLAEMQSYSAQGYRLSTFELNQLPPNLTMHCSMVRNTGVYSAGWYFFLDKTRAELLALCNQHNARIVDLERYLDNGQEKLAALLFVNSGAQQKAWSWHTNLAPGSIWSTLSGLGRRAIDIEPYTENGQQRYHVVSIANTGNDYRPWWVYTNATSSDVQGYLAQHDARLYDYELENVLTGRACALLVRDALPSLTLWGNGYFAGFDDDVENGGRVVGLGWQSLGARVITLLDNLDPFTASGFACSGTQGPTLQSASGNALTGTAVTFRCENLRPWAPTFLVYGLQSQTLSLANFGAPFCYGLVVPMATETRFANGSGVASDTLTIPNSASFAGLPLTTQFLALDPGNNALGLQASRRLRTRIRHW